MKIVLWAAAVVMGYFMQCAACDEAMMDRLLLANAIDRGKTEVVSELLSKSNSSCNINAAYGSFRTPLLRAIEARRINILSMLLKGRANPLTVLKERENSYFTVFHYALYRKDEEAFAALTENMSMHDLLIAYNTVDARRQSPLFIAVENKSISAIETMLQYDSSYIGIPSLHDNTVLHIAVTCGDFKTLCMLLHTSAGRKIINHANEEGMTPLHIAALAQYSFSDVQKVIKLLLDNGANPCKRDNNMHNAKDYLLSRRVAPQDPIILLLDDAQQRHIAQHCPERDYSLSDADSFYVEGDVTDIESDQGD